MPTRDGAELATAPDIETLTIKDYKSGDKPVWCPGCGDFGVLSATYKALAQLQLQKKDVVVVSGIGCSSRTPYFMSTYGFHGVHGRSLPIATGITFVARGSPAKPNDLTELIRKGIEHKGFSFLHVQSPCAEFFNTYDYYDEHITPLPEDWDTHDLEKAMALATTEEKVNLGV